MSATIVYYEFEPILGVNSTYHDGVQFRYDYFSSMYLFNLWIQYELGSPKTVEITDANYQELKSQELI